MLNSLGADWIFQSTLSLRRATGGDCYTQSERRDFNPRSPCGERRRLFPKGSAELAISIHALLAESDDFMADGSVPMTGFQSTLSLRRATILLLQGHNDPGDFNPRSPCGERLLFLHSADELLIISIHALLAESDILVQPSD